MSEKGKIVFTVDTRQFSGNVQEFINRHAERVYKGLDEAGMKIQGEAKNLAPVDKGFLTADIHQNTIKTEKGIYYSYIYVPTNAHSASYAVKMHEEHYNLGPNSEIRQQKLGKVIGRRFISRAMYNTVKEVRNMIKQALRIK